MRDTNTAGPGLPRRAFAMSRFGPGTEVTGHSGDSTTNDAADNLAALRPGDLVFFNVDPSDGPAADHTGIFLGVDGSGRYRFISSRTSENGPTMGDTKYAPILDGDGHFAVAFRNARRLQYLSRCGEMAPGGSDMPSAQLYDTIGATYPVTRRTEPRIAAQVWAALGDARTVLNVGAGTGSYEPADRDVIAVEPSALMRAQRPAGAAPCVAAAAECLPFGDGSFDAAMAFATIHHWQDPVAGLREMRRVARRVVVFTHDTSDAGWLRRFWLTRDYLPEVADLIVGRPSVVELADAIGARLEPVLIPWDCVDGFFEAYWRQPEAYLDESVRRGISVWARVGPDAEQRAVHSLRDDLASGRWARRNRDLVDLDAAELGLRLLIA